MKKPACCICEGRETVESLEWLQYLMESGRARPTSAPVCSVHYSKLEECHREINKIRTPPVIVNVSAVTSGGRGGSV